MIQECGEPLCSVPRTEKLHAESEYFKRGLLGATQQVYVRESVAARLVSASEKLPDGVRLRVSDGYRPLQIQQQLWDEVYASARLRHPDWSADALHEFTARFVALPQNRPDRPPPHLTGGAVDVCLTTMDGVELAMGSDFDGEGESALTAAFESQPESVAAKNRRLLYHTMISAGFANYPNEWWHYEWGTLRWALHSGVRCAVFGGIPEWPATS